MGSVLKRLNIRSSEKPIILNFFIFNLVLYSGIFLGRAIRDALFFANIGAQYLPAIFILNAITMTFFGPRFAKWTGEGYSLKKVSVTLLIFSAGVIAIFSVLFILNPQGNIFNTSIPILNVIIVLFYWLTEIPIFLMIMLIWVIADNYISESQGQRINPKIIGGGHIGIVIGGSIAVFAPELFRIEMQTLAFVWTGITVAAAVMVLVIYKNCEPLPQEFIDENAEEENVAPDMGIKASYRAVKKYKFALFFMFITLFNFFLFGINDYMLNARAIEAEIREADLIMILGYFTIGFGILSAIVQFTSITALIKKIGIARTNLGGPLIFVGGSVILLFTSTHMFEPVQNLILDLTGIEKAQLFLFGIAIARFGGYIAEYLFNQTLLPSIYGALPFQDRGTIRSFLEGPFTQIVFGATGIFLIGYKFVFKDNLDLLILIGAVSASLMLIFSWFSISEYKTVIQESKKSVNEKIIGTVIGTINRQKLLSLFSKKNSFLTTSLIDFLAKSKRHEFTADIFGQLGENKKVNLSVLNAIIDLNRLDYFDKAMELFIEFLPEKKKILRFKRGDRKEISMLLSGFYRLQHNYDIMVLFDDIENNSNCTEEQKLEVFKIFAKLENKSGIVKAGNILEKIEDRELAIKLSTEIGFDKYVEDIHNELSNCVKIMKTSEETDISQRIVRLQELLTFATKISYPNQSQLFETFKVLLSSSDIIESRRDSLEAAKKMIKKNPNLCLLAANYFFNHPKPYALAELPPLLADLPFIPEKDIAYIKNIEKVPNTDRIPFYNGGFSVNHLLETFIRKGSPLTTLNAYKVLVYRINKKIEESWGLQEPSVLFSGELKKTYLSWALAENFKPINTKIYKLSLRRVDLYKKSMLYSLSLIDKENSFEVEEFYNNIVLGNSLQKDNSITILEQVLPRDCFKEVDEYFYIDDAGNKAREAELADRARIRYPEEIELSNALEVLNDDILNNLIKAVR